LNGAKVVRCLHACAVLAMLSGVGPVWAGDLPSFQPGFWSFSSTVSLYGADKPQVRTMSRCADPTADIRSKWESLAAQSCKFSPVAHTGNQYSYSASCNKQGRAVSMKSVIVVKDENAYRVETLSHTNTQASREIIVARRVSSCPK
jgi:hypothetical protein